jgi:hypothetical protein
MQITRAIVVTAIGLSLLSTAAACGATKQSTGPTAVTSSSSAPVAVSLPTRDELADKYLAAAKAYNDVWFKTTPMTDKTTLAQGKAVGTAMANANWTLIEDFRAMRKSVEVPNGNYPKDKDFYNDIHTTLGQAIDKSLHLHQLWTRMRDSETRAELMEAWEDPSYADDGVVARRMRSLLGLPDIPTG